MNNHHEIVSVHGVSCLKYEGGFFPKRKAFHEGGSKLFWENL